MVKFTIRGTKKLLGLARTKIRLAKEAETKHTKPAPLPLVKLLSGQEVVTVEQAEEYLENLKSNIDYDDPKNVAKTILELTDMIEGVKYRFEPREFMFNVDEKQLNEIELNAKEKQNPINLLLMTEKAADGLNLFVGYNQPENTIFLSRVPTTTACFLNYAFKSSYFSEGLKLRNINIILGHKTLILNAIAFALREFNVNLIDKTRQKTKQ